MRVEVHERFSGCVLVCVRHPLTTHGAVHVGLAQLGRLAQPVRLVERAVRQELQQGRAAMNAGFSMDVTAFNCQYTRRWTNMSMADASRG